MDSNTTEQGVRLSAWVWTAYLRAALIPLLLVEAVIIVIYLLATSHGTEQNLASARELATEELERIARRESALIDRELQGVADVTALYTRQIRRVLTDEGGPDPAEASRYHFKGEALVDVDAGKGERCSLFFSGIKPIGQGELDKVYRTARLDPLMQDIVDSHPLVSQIYYNTHDSMNRICPPFDVLSQYVAKMDIPSYNFYYLADATHNPNRAVAWTDAYVDPAGQGWMASCIAPVYIDESLEGVSGLDITLESFAGRVLNLEIPWDGYGVLLGRDGTILAMPETAERDFGMRELTQHHCADVIHQDTFKPDSYNVFKRTDFQPLASALSSGLRLTSLEFDGLEGPRLVAWETVPSTGWTLVIVAPEERIFASINALDTRLRGVGYWMIAGVAVFYVLFLLMLMWRARAMAQTLVEPLETMDRMVLAIGQGDYRQEALNHPVTEVQRTSDGLVSMGRALEVAAAEVQRAQGSLERQAAFLQVIIDTVPVPVFFTDSQGVILGTNAELEVATAGVEVTAVVAELTARARDEVEVFWGHGGREFLFRSTPLPAGGAPDAEGGGFVGVLIDVTASRQAQQLAEQARDDAVAASRMKSEFLAAVSHEIRTPMNGVLGMTEILGDTELSPQQSEYIAIIRESAEALLRVINDILDFSRVEAGRISVTDEVFSPAAITEGVAEVLTPRARQRGISLRCFVHPEVPETVRGDGGRIRQVLLNLLGNAVKFTEVGEVAVSARVAHADGEWTHVRWEVRDTGPGIAAEDQHRLFLPFSQVDGSAVRRFGGTGLGLSISKGLVELLGGEIGCVSARGEGASFHFTLPLRREETRALAAPEGLRVLLVETDGAVAENLRDYVEAFGGTIEVVADLGEVESALRAGPVDRVALGGAATPGLRLDIERIAPDAAIAAVGMRDRIGGALAGAAILTLPLKRHQVLAFLTGSSEAGSASQERSILFAGGQAAVEALLVEDDPVSRLIVERRLVQLGIPVTARARGDEALRYHRERGVGLVILDLAIPGLDGYEVARGIRDNDRDSGQRTWILVVTAASVDGGLEALQAAGMDDYLVKPFTAEQLATHIERALRHSTVV